ncbi:discoidin domain-containing protein [Primorskyibacter sp. S187A]|uniref:discoidin domain-containing protein n=1 Tax=Primorskyibacter sp. S187A TaxID=3415130 RepID=UPI003C7BA030
MSYLKTALAASAVAIATTGMASATIIGATGVVVDAGGSSGGPVAVTIDQTGLNANYISGTTDFDSFVATTTHSFIASTEWFGDFQTNSGQLTFDLGSAQAIDAMALWNEESSGAGTFDLSTSLDGSSYTSLLTGLSGTDHTTLTDYAADVFTFATTTFRYIRMTMSGCPQPGIGSYESCAVGEVAFRAGEDVMAPIPLPGALPLALSGLFAFGGLQLRKRRKS